MSRELARAAAPDPQPHCRPPLLRMLRASAPPKATAPEAAPAPTARGLAGPRSASQQKGRATQPGHVRPIAAWPALALKPRSPGPRCRCPGRGVWEHMASARGPQRFARPRCPPLAATGWPAAGAPASRLRPAAAQTPPGRGNRQASATVALALASAACRLKPAGRPGAPASAAGCPLRAICRASRPARHDVPRVHIFLEPQWLRR